MKKITERLISSSGMALLAVAALTLTSCYASGPYARQGAVGGAVAGATAGGIVGHQSGSGLEGAAIGAALGMLGGAIFGSAKDDYYYGAPRRTGYYDAPGPPRRQQDRPPYGDRYIY